MAASTCTFSNIPIDPTVIKLRMRHKNVTKACTECRKAHSKCVNERPCHRCASKGTVCIDTPKRSRARQDFSDLRFCMPNFKLKNERIYPTTVVAAPCVETIKTEPTSHCHDTLSFAHHPVVASYDEFCKLLDSIQ